jgi:hypothetical protein
LVVTGGACGFGSQATFTLDSASVDTAYSCPRGSSNATYDLHAALAAHNPTSSSVTIKTVTAKMTLAAVNGGWMQHVGDTFDAGSATFNPDSVGSSSNRTIDVVVRSACTNQLRAGQGASFADYSVSFGVSTSAGTINLTSKNRHRITAS